jgi:hypothetical protein
MFALLEEKQKGHFEAEKLPCREAGAGRRGGNVLREGLRENTEDSGAAKHVYGVPGVGDAEKTKGIEVLEKKYRDEKKYREKEYEEAQQEVDEKQKAHLTCLEHHLDLWHLCGGKIMDTQEPINHTKLLRKLGYKFKHSL